jgi:hypothetical protein
MGWITVYATSLKGNLASPPYVSGYFLMLHGFIIIIPKYLAVLACRGKGEVVPVLN